MRTINRWDFTLEKYIPYNIPKEWKITTFETDMNAICNCVRCGKEITFGECYTSREFHTENGFGYATCEGCYYTQFQEENARRSK